MKTKLTMIENASYPKVSIITVNYRQMAVTKEFLASVKNLSYPNYETLLIDNGASEDNSVSIGREFPNVIYLRSSSNLGFAGANNLGISNATGSFYFIVNNDTEITPNILQHLLDCFQKKPDAGAVSPKIMYFNHPSIIQYAGFTTINKFTGRNKMLGDGQEDRGQFNLMEKTAYCHGAAMLVKREVVDKIGGFYEGYFMYYEEIDWCLKMSRNGFGLYYQPTAVIYHKDSVTTGKESPLKTFYYFRNRILFMRRSYKPYQTFVFYIYFTLIVMPLSLCRFVLRKQWSNIPSAIRGVLWNLKTPLTA